MPVEQDAPRARRIEARQEVDQRGLAAARGPDERQRLTRADAQIDAGERGFDARRVSEMHALERHFAAGVADRDMAAVFLRRRIHQPEDTFGRGEAALDVRIQLGEMLDRREQHQHRGHERGEFTDRRSRREDVLHREVDDHRDRGGGQHVRDRRGEPGRHLAAQQEAAQVLGRLQEALRLIGIAAVHLDHLLAVDRLLQHVHQFPGDALRAARHVAQPRGDQSHGQRDGRRDRERDERQLPVQVEEPDEQADDRDRISHQHGEHEGRRAAHVLHVVRDL